MLKKAAFVLLLLVLLAVALASGSVAYLLRSTVPSVNGEYTLAGLDRAVQIVFDKYERPFVTAVTLEHALTAEGFLHAQHRLWQMELFRRAAKGRLSELLGSDMLDSDKELWRMGVPQLARQLAANAPPQMQGYVEAYVEGVNAAIDAQRFPPPEFLLLRTAPEPWTPNDVYAVGALMAFQSANNARNELLRLALFDQLGEARAEIFLPNDSAQAEFPYVMPAPAGNAARGALRTLDRLAAVDPNAQVLMPGFGFGSNGWVVSPGRSDTGHALFAFDSHDSLGVPNLFYEVHLFFANDREIRGWSVPGLPGVINGYNERIAWGFTNTGDTQDLFVETRSKEDPLQFKNGDSWYAARTETIEIPVRGQDAPESLTIVYTKNGPLIFEDPPIALSWTVQHLDGMGLDGILDINLAQNWAEFTAALDRFPAPSLNATYADAGGNIGFRTVGLLPIRGKGDGLVPLDGSVPGNRWQGIVAPEDLPEILNPRAGYIAAANARINPEGHGLLVSADNAPGYRIGRLHDVLSARRNFTLDDMRALQRDWHDGQASLLMPSLLPALRPDTMYGIERAAHNALTAWESSYEAKPDSTGAIIWQAWYRALAEEVFRPGMSEALFAHLFKNNYPLNHALDRLILDEPGSAWWRGDRGAIVQTAFTAAVDEIRTIQGGDVAAWRLDAMHSVLLEHELGKAVPQLARFFNLAPSPWGGSTATVGRARYRYDRAYNATGGATVRVVGEMGATIRMKAVMPTGQSGHPLSPHYGDQLDQWLAGDVIPIPKGLARFEGPFITLKPQR